MENQPIVEISSLLLVIALIVGTGRLIKTTDFLSNSMANRLVYENLMVSGTNPDLFYSFGLCEQEFKGNQDRDQGFPRTGLAYMDGLWRFTLGKSETANVSINRAFELEQSLVYPAFALGVVRNLSVDEQMANNTWSQNRGSLRLLL